MFLVQVVSALIIAGILASASAKQILQKTEVNLDEAVVPEQHEFNTPDVIRIHTLSKNAESLPNLAVEENLQLKTGDEMLLESGRQRSCQNVRYTASAIGQRAIIKSPNYPLSYPYNAECSYSVTSPVNTQLTISCGVNIACGNPGDSIFWSLTGDPFYSDAVGYCGAGTIDTQRTSANSITIGFRSGNTRRPPSFSSYYYDCEVKVVSPITPVTPITPTTTSTTTANPTTTTQGPLGASSSTTPATTTLAGLAPACSCGIRNIDGVSRIVGGSPAKKGEIPWRVAIYFYSPTTGRDILCGGTIISQDWILTAAHCTMDIKPGQKMDVYVGAHENPVTVGSGTAVNISHFVQHPEFRRQTLENDICLLHLLTPLTFTPSVSPSCLPFGKLATANYSGTSVLASGWGSTKPVPVDASNSNPVSPVHLEVVLPVLTSSQCRNYYKQVTDNQICTYQPGKDACQGDSGGSIDYQSTNTFYYSIGVVSSGFGCAQKNYPGLYVFVPKYLDWIQAVTAGTTFCRPPT